MRHLLAGDIGGTKTILRLVRQPPEDCAPLEVVGERRYQSADYPDLVPLVRFFFEELGVESPPEAACFAVAGPVVGGTCRVTNLPWMLDANRMGAALGIGRVRLINDFAAVAWGVPELVSADLHTLQSGELDPGAPIAVIGAGTGLGEAFLIPVPTGGHRVFPSEGGHSDFSPRNLREFELASYLREVSQIPRVSVERVVSGTGIRSIYEFLRSRDPSAEGAELKRIYAVYEEEIGRRPKTVDLSAAVSKAALAGSDPLAVETMDLFVEAYGAEAGNLALKLLPYGGLYVAGGVVAKIVPLLETGRFLEAFRDKGRMRPLMERVPLHLVLDSRVGLLGASRRAAVMAAESAVGAH